MHGVSLTKNAKFPTLLSTMTIIRDCKINAKLMPKSSAIRRIVPKQCQMLNSNFYSQVSLKCKIWLIFHFRMPVSNCCDALDNLMVKKCKFAQCSV